MPEQRQSPYIWVTWLSKLLAGDNSCEWASWFRAQHEGWSYEKTPSTFDQATWQMEHTELLNRVRDEPKAGNNYVRRLRQDGWITSSP